MMVLVRNRGKSDTQEAKRNNKGAQEEDPSSDGTYAAALRATAPVVPITAMLSTVLAHVALEDVSDKLGIIEDFAVVTDASALVLGSIAAIITWLAVARFYRRFTTARSSSPRNYNLLREKLDQLKNRIKHLSPESSASREEAENGIDRIVRKIAYERALNECKEIEKKLEGRGISWITGIGYIELWHRVHRAEEALIKVEPCTEAIAGAMRDESRLEKATMANRDLLLRRLRCAVAILDSSETGESLNYLAEPVECSLPKEERATPKNRAKAITILSEVRFEINYFRDSVWEGIVHARNRLISTSILLGFAAYALLGLAILANAPHATIVWGGIYFLVGAIAGLFARAQAEWSTDTAVDDFGLSTARLVNIPWHSGVAAVGGVLVSSVLGSQFMHGAASNPTTLATVFDNQPTLLIVAAVFGLTPDLIIRRLTQQVERYKTDLQSTQISQSTKVSQGTDTGQRH